MLTSTTEEKTKAVAEAAARLDDCDPEFTLWLSELWKVKNNTNALAIEAIRRLTPQGDVTKYLDSLMDAWKFWLTSDQFEELREELEVKNYKLLIIPTFAALVWFTWLFQISGVSSIFALGLSAILSGLGAYILGKFVL